MIHHMKISYKIFQGRNVSQPANRSTWCRILTEFLPLRNPGNRRISCLGYECFKLKNVLNLYNEHDVVIGSEPAHYHVYDKLVTNQLTQSTGAVIVKIKKKQSRSKLNTLIRDRSNPSKFLKKPYSMFSTSNKNN